MSPSAGDDEDHTAFTDEAASGGLEAEGAEALSVHAALALRMKELDTHGHEMFVDEAEEELGLVRSGAVVRHDRDEHGPAPVEE